ncbi:PD-(D/E)XK nuclease family protein [Pedobacter chitinilyticus]|uniref:PD-(D/E)XK nuclease family protein n=1 Tax=Pedobacter chitinilyticus TaxID=2233776 RepID=A0A443YU96_9SPHI|nr:PD-(D/E)XK nuclease family protein [Pedobacter chitinilyticus]RWU07439.1 PD-(D/E)XK nuclease family protein [Pedobacter chitinilyticus]
MTPFLKEVAEDLVAKFGDDLQYCAIVFNNNRPATYLRKYLADIIQKPFFSPAIYTIQEFFAGSVKEKPADFYLQFFTLLKVYNKLLEEEGLAPMKSSQFFPLAKIMLSDFAQIDNDLVDANKLYQEMEDVAQINLEFDYLSKEQYDFLAQFWQSYSEGKHKKQQELFIKMWRRMPRLYQLFHEELKAQNYITNGQVYRHLANTDLTTSDFINSFNRGKIIFVGFNALTRAEAKVFTHLKEADKALFYFDVDTYYLEDELQEAGLFLRKNFKQLGLTNVFEDDDNGFASEKHAVNVYKVQGQSAQAKILNQIIGDEDGNQELGTTAVILADEQLLMPALQTINDGIDLNVTMGFALAGSTVFGLADLWLTTQLELKETNKVDHQTLEAFVTHPLTGLSTKLKANVQEALLRDNVVNIDLHRLIKQGGIFERFYQKIEDPSRLVEELLSVMKYMLARLSTQQSLKKIDADLMVKTIEELTRLNDTLRNFVAGEEFRFVVQLIQKSLLGVSVPLSGDPLKGVQLMGLLESRNLNFDKLVFLGFNEGIIPKTSIGNSFIPDSIRRAYGLPVLENLDAISSYMVYRLLQRAKSINFVYNSLTDERNSGEVSRILKQLEYESNFSFNYQSLNLPVSTEPKEEIVIDKNDPVIQAALQRYLKGEKILSPSALTMYIANPIDFFFRYIAEIKEPEEVTAVIEANQIGSILHKVMEYFYIGEIGKEVTADVILVKRKALKQMVTKAFNFVMTNKEESTLEYSGMQKVILAIVEAYANIILNRDEADAPFTILSLEEKISTELAFELNGKMQQVKLFGFIDRVDERNGVTRIIDYKTGSDKLTFSEIEKLFDTDGKSINKALIQTLIYTYAYERQSGRQGVEPSLFVVKTMADGNVYFRSRKSTLSDAYLEEVKPLFLAQLQQKVAEIFDLNVPFRASAVPDNYSYSIYKTLFGA